MINNEGNMISSDAGFVSGKTISYPEREFINEGILKLKQKCLKSSYKSLNKWALSVDKIKPSFEESDEENEKVYTNENLKKKKSFQ